MNLGQVLAMLAQGQDPQRYTAPQTQSSIPIPWQQIAAIPPADAEPVGFAKLPPVEVTASRLPALPEQMDPLSLYEAELYGGPVTQQESVGTAQTPMPMANYEFAPMQQPAMAKLPPLPIQGYTPVQQPEITTRAPRALTDVPQEEPMAMAMGQDIAMLSPMAQPQMPAAPTAEDAKAEEERKKQEAAKLWRPTDDFTVTYKNKTYTVPGGTFKSGQQATIMLPSGRAANLQQADNPELYDAINTEFQNRIQAAQPSPDNQGFTSQVLIDDEWLPAKVDTATNRVTYKDTEGNVFGYPTPLDLTPDENYRGPALPDRDPNADLTALQTSIRQFTSPYRQKLTQTAQPFRRISAASETMQRIKPVWGREKAEEYSVFPKLSWEYEYAEGGQRYTIPLEEAVQRNLVGENVLRSLNQAADREIRTVEESAAQFGRMMGTKAPTMREQDLQIIEAAIADNAQKQQAATTAKELANLKKDEAALQDKRDNIMSRLSTSVQAGGVTITEAPQAERGTSLDPTKPLDALAIARGGATIEPNTGAVRRPTLENFAESIKDVAMPKFEQAEISPNIGYTSSINAVNARLGQIESDASESDKYGSNPSQILDVPSQFRFVDWRAGQSQDTPEADKIVKVMTLRQALDDYYAASEALRDATAKAGTEPGSQEDLKAARIARYEAALPFSGTVTIPELGTYPLHKGISSESIFATAGPTVSLRTPEVQVVNPAVVESRPAPADTTAPRSGTKPPPTAPQTSWFPGWNKGASAKGMPEKVKVNSSFKLADMIDLTNGPVFQFTVDKYSPMKSNITVASDMGRALGRDDGTLDTQGTKAVSNTIKAINDFMVTPNSPEAQRARDTYATIAYHALNSVAGSDSTGSGLISQTATGFVGKLNDIYNAKDEQTANKLIDKLLADCGLSDIRRYANTETAVKLDATDRTIPGNKYSENGVPVLYNQLRAYVYDLGTLFKNAGLYKSSSTPGTPRSWQGSKVTPTITWFADWTTPAGRAGDVQSALTVPSASLNTGMAPVTSKTEAEGKNALNNPLDPTISRVIGLGGSSILLESENLNEILTKSNVLTPFINQAESGWKTNVGGPYGGNAYRNATDWRKEDEDSNTVFDNASKQSVTKVFTGGNILYNLFPAMRLRGRK